MSEIRNATALVTGGASGIGYLTGRLLLEQGAQRLVIWDIQEAALARVVAELSAAGRDVIGERVDVADAAQLRAAVQRLEEREIAVDLLLNNAGIVVGKAFAAHSEQDIERTMRINAVAPMQLTRALLPGMLARGRGHIVNIASAAGLATNPGMTVYAASKWSMVGWSDSLRLELEQAHAPVRVTTVTPYYIDTGMFEGVRSPFIPLLKQEYVARRIVDAIRRDRIFLRLPRLINFVPLLRGLLGVRGFDRVAGRWLRIYDSMSTFRGRT